MSRILRRRTGVCFHYLAAYGAAILPRVIVQIYRLGELDEARALHPRAAWLTAYKWSYPAWAMKRIVGVDAFVVPVGDYGRYRDAMATTRRPLRPLDSCRVLACDQGPLSGSVWLLYQLILDRIRRCGAEPIP